MFENTTINRKAARREIKALNRQERARRKGARRDYEKKFIKNIRDEYYGYDFKNKYAW